MSLLSWPPVRQTNKSLPRPRILDQVTRHPNLTRYEYCDSVFTKNTHFTLFPLKTPPFDDEIIWLSKFLVMFTR